MRVCVELFQSGLQSWTDRQTHIWDYPLSLPACLKNCVLMIHQWKIKRHLKKTSLNNNI